MAYGEARGQLAEVVSSSRHGGLQDQTRVVWLSGKFLYQLLYLGGPKQWILFDLVLLIFFFKLAFQIMTFIRLLHTSVSMNFST